MAGAAELFTVCRSCGQQVSSFVTECPYCGARLRRRAPRLERRDGDLEALLRQPAVEPDRTIEDDDVVVPLKRPKRRFGRGARGPGPRTPRRRPAAPSLDRRPWVTIVLLLASLIGVPVAQAIDPTDLLLTPGLGDVDPWRYATAVFSYPDVWHGVGVLTTLGVFGWLWERRAGVVGSLVVLLAFLVGGVGGLVAAAEAASGADFLAGGGGAAAMLAAAWIVAELRARQRNESLDGDLLGASVLLATTVLVSAVAAAGAPLAAVLGGVLGIPLGLALSAARR